MKPKIIYLLFFLISAINNGSAQNMLQQGNQWIFEDQIWSFLHGYNIDTTIETITVTGDTMINDKTYARLTLSRHPPCWNVTNPEYLRSEGSKIYRLSRDHSQEFLMIDYEETTGYEMLYDTYSGVIDTGRVLIDSFGIEYTFDGIPLDVQYMKIINNQSFDDSATYKVYKDIGFLYSSILFPNLGTGLCDFTDNIFFRCAVIGLDTFHFTQYDCFELPIIDATKDITITEVNLQPNPAIDIVMIPDGYQLTGVYDLQGTYALPYHDDKTIDISYLASGMYIFQFIGPDGKRAFYGKVIKL